MRKKGKPAPRGASAGQEAPQKTSGSNPLRLRKGSRVTFAPNFATDFVGGSYPWPEWFRPDHEPVITVNGVASWTGRTRTGAAMGGTSVDITVPGTDPRTGEARGYWMMVPAHDLVRVRTPDA